MKLTRYFQSCLLVEEGKARILIDPSGQDAGNFDKFGKLDAVIYTHEHGDHFDPDLAQKFMDGGVTTYANASTAKQMKSQPKVVKDGEDFQIKGVNIQARELPHCLMVDGSKSVQNTGFVVAERLFHSGDGTEISGVSVEIVAAPITGPDISLKDAADLAKSVSAKIVVPVHYDYIGTKPEVFAAFAEHSDAFEVKIIGMGQTAEV